MSRSERIFSSNLTRSRRRGESQYFESIMPMRAKVTGTSAKDAPIRRQPWFKYVSGDRREKEERFRPSFPVFATKRGRARRAFHVKCFGADYGGDLSIWTA